MTTNVIIDYQDILEREDLSVTKYSTDLDSYNIYVCKLTKSNEKYLFLPEDSGRMGLAIDSLNKFILQNSFNFSYFVPLKVISEIDRLATKDLLHVDSTEAKQTLVSVFSDADEYGSSDIHFVRNDQQCDIYFRVDGNKSFYKTLDTDSADAAISTFYNVEAISKGSAWNRKVPQDAMGPIPSLKGKILNLRYAHSPLKTRTEQGYHAVFRVLQDGGVGEISDLTDLGFSPEESDLIKKMVSRPFGLVVVAGTTGSGKSTTIKGFLEWLYLSFHNKSISVLTVEDPVEYSIRGAVQTNVKRNELKGDDTNPFMRYIYSAMRRDPDVLLIGETRDPATAKALTDVVESGHLAVTTLHASSVTGVISRLNSLGIEMDKLRSYDFWAGIIVQKLLRRTCTHCSLPFNFDDETLKSRVSHGLYTRLIDKNADIHISSESGCEKCSYSGYKGRQICVEFLFPYNEVIDSVGTQELFATWKRYEDGVSGYTMSENAFSKIVAGTLCPQEYERIYGVN
ncbi:Flp pilus assembly complex ATPase component TadA [Vibrio mediterranei]|uniref:GspE/PulE family protein n=1 Tax=Vibrio TaxID=662 RepID=UPI0017E75335|nr:MULTISPECIES: ATPase, T2SS/T4P/T4SS family [Vibrio]NUW73658.1 Flp pilus assembly complex ATPase component TadA [Vibrio mediterranei]USE00163.1 Flp pilus assembly complex ATPase component TadA [Vibrio sp. SCSIO 43133]